MSKAFVKDDALPTEQPVVQPMDWALTESSGKFYLTPSGWRRLTTELAAARTNELKITDANGKATARRRVQTLEGLIQISEVIDPTKQTGDRARFGATVTVRDADDTLRTYRIVGTYEADAGSGKISYLSPLAKALLGKRPGDEAVAKTPNGEEDLEIVHVAYLPIDDESATS